MLLNHIMNLYLFKCENYGKTKQIFKKELKCELLCNKFNHM